MLLRATAPLRRPLARLSSTLTTANINQSVLTAQYAVRGELVLKAAKIKDDMAAGTASVPFDKVLQHEHQGQKVNVTDVGLLYKPKEHCTPLRAVDKRTGFFCDLLVVDTEHEDGHWALQWPSGPRACPHAPEPSRQCDSKACYRLPGTSMYPARRCWLAQRGMSSPAHVLTRFARSRTSRTRRSTVAR